MVHSSSVMTEQDEHPMVLGLTASPMFGGNPTAAFCWKIPNSMVSAMVTVIFSSLLDLTLVDFASTELKAAFARIDFNGMSIN
ncbi:hypothetical protein BDR06DRAFT_1006446 [Suillus hirtellus]|nr:hypothetical protein BDR06DRAFT_1006446 [Suillus hirtellus]